MADRHLSHRSVAALLLVGAVMMLVAPVRSSDAVEDSGMSETTATTLEMPSEVGSRYREDPSSPPTTLPAGRVVPPDGEDPATADEAAASVVEPQEGAAQETVTFFRPTGEKDPEGRPIADKQILDAESGESLATGGTGEAASPGGRGEQGRGRQCSRLQLSV